MENVGPRHYTHVHESEEERTAGLALDDSSADLFTVGGADAAVVPVVRRDGGAVQRRAGVTGLNIAERIERTGSAAASGDEMNYWRHLQNSEATLRRRPKASSTAVGT